MTLFLISAFVGVQCYQLLRQNQAAEVAHQQAASRTRQDLNERLRPVPLQYESQVPAKRDCPCPPDDGIEDDEEDVLSDVGEAAFGIIGSMWAAGALPTPVVFPDVDDHAHHDIWATASLGDTLEEKKLQMAVQLLKQNSGYDEQRVTDAISDFLKQSATSDSSMLSGSKG